MDQRSGQVMPEKDQWCASHATSLGTRVLTVKPKVQMVIIRELEVLTLVNTAIWSATTAIRKDARLWTVDRSRTTNIMVLLHVNNIDMRILRIGRLNQCRNTQDMVIMS